MQRILRGTGVPLFVVLSAVVLIAMFAAPGGAQKLGSGPTGAIFTTMPDGGIVNENVRYPSKSYVYLDGGPPPNAPATAAGLDDGQYVFQITDPSGKILLSEDPARCRVIEVEGGLITRLVPPSELIFFDGIARSDDQGERGNPSKVEGNGDACHIADPPHPFDPAFPDDFGTSNRHDTNTDVDHGAEGAITVQMMPYGTTPNPGGVYKAWITPLDVYLARGGDLDEFPKQLNKGQQRPHECPDFCAENDPGFGPPRSVQKTDNFKVLDQQPMLKVLKFEDMNGNGEKDADDPYIDGWEITITETLYDGSTVDTTCYTPCSEVFAPNTTITVTEEMLEGWQQSHLSLDGTILEVSASVDVTFLPGELEHTVVFGNWDPISLSGTKWEDVDGNGTRDDGDDGLAGWTIYVDYNDNGSLDDGEPSATTADGGSYTIDGIKPGDWTVREVDQDGWTCSFPTTSCDHDISIVSGDMLDGYDFGNWEESTKSGVKFEDLDGDGAAREDGEPGLAGVTIYLDLNDNGVHDSDEPSAVTGDDGSYEITGIAPGTWTFREVQQDGWTCSYPDGCAHTETFTSGSSQTGNDFGNWYPATKSGLKVQDVDRNSQYDPGTDIGIAGWTFFVDYDGDGVHDEGEPSATSGDDGSYEITGIKPGTWNVLEIDDEPNWACAFPQPCLFTHAFTSQSVFADNIFGNRTIEGCTPGYWKQDQHLDSWLATSFVPTQSVASVFASAASDPYAQLGAATLQQALDFQGGDSVEEAAEILLRAAVASILNQTATTVAYDSPVADIIGAVNGALDSLDRNTILTLAAALDASNNRLCPLN